MLYLGRAERSGRRTKNREPRTTEPQNHGTVRVVNAVSRDYTYRNLVLWQKAQTLAVQVIQITQHLPHTWGNAIIARQIIASATSISANVAEGHGRYSFGAYRNHLSIAKGSATETDSWLDLLRQLGAIS